MKINIVFLLLFIIITPIFSADLNNVGTQLTNAVSAAVGSWTAAFSSAGAFIFYVLATIELVIVFGFLALKGELDFGAIMANLIRLTLIFGFWMMLLGTFGIGWMKTIPASFEQLATLASGTAISTNNLFSQIATVYDNLWSSLSFWDNPAESFMLVLVGFITLIVMILLGVKVLTNLVFATLAVYMSSLFFAFGVFSQTRQWAINSIVNVIRYGAKYMGVLLMAGLGITLLNSAITTANGDMSTANIFILLIFAFIFYSLAHGIENFIDGYFTGMGGGENTLGGGLAKSMMIGAGIGAAAGATGSLSQVKAAAAVGEGATPPGSNLGAGQTSEQTGKGTGKIGNFVKSATAGVAGGVAGAASGMIKGSIGVSTHSAGQKSGSGVGKAVVGMSNLANKMTKSTSNQTENTPGQTSANNLEGTISSSANPPGQTSATNNNSYLSGVPGATSKKT
jgi:P-type conjugative transfer protein TrbL